jgi:hypothetical protein
VAVLLRSLEAALPLLAGGVTAAELFASMAAGQGKSGAAVDPAAAAAAAAAAPEQRQPDAPAAPSLEPLGFGEPGPGAGSAAEATTAGRVAALAGSPLDLYHYFNHPTEVEEAARPVDSNCAEHTDRGLLSCIALSPVMGLRLRDAASGRWASPESWVRRHPPARHLPVTRLAARLAPRPWLCSLHLAAVAPASSKANGPALRFGLVVSVCLYAGWPH